jgi:hypothetical protein
MHTQLTLVPRALVAAVGLVVAATLPAPAYALNCQYQGHPESVVRSSPGFGVVFGQFRLVNSPSACPDQIQAIQFAGSVSAEAATFVSTIEICFDMAMHAMLLEDVLHEGLRIGIVTIELHDPLTGNPGVVIGNSQALAVVNTCRIASVRRTAPRRE